MSLDPAAIAFLKELLARHLAQWQARGAGPEAQSGIDAFLKAIKEDDRFWQQWSDWVAERNSSLDIAGLRAAFPDALPPGLMLTEYLATSKLGPDESELFLNLFQIGIPREERIRKAFAAGDPTATAKALEQIARPEPPHPLAARFSRWTETSAGKLTAVGLLTGLLLATYYSGCGSMPSDSQSTSDNSQGISHAMYKGVTPDPIC